MVRTTRTERLVMRIQTGSGTKGPRKWLEPWLDPGLK